jgi:hypothetical protein
MEGDKGFRFGRLGAVPMVGADGKIFFASALTLYSESVLNYFGNVRA